MKCSLKHDLVAVTVLTLISLSISLLFWSFTSYGESDSASYVKGAMTLAAGKGYLSLSNKPEITFPPGYSLAIAPLTKVIADPFVAARLVATLASALCVIPMYLVIAAYWKRSTAVITCLMFSVMNWRIIYSNTVMSESIYLLFLLTSLALWIYQSKKYTLPGSVALGLSLGLMFLIRPEGLVVAASMVALYCFGRKFLQMPSARTYLIALGVMFLVMSPYVVFLHSHTGKWCLSTKGSINYRQSIASYRGTSWAEMSKIDRNGKPCLNTISETRLEFAKRYCHNLAVVVSMTPKSVSYALAALGLVSLLVLGLSRKISYVKDALPLLLVFLSPLIIICVFRVESRMVYVVMPAFLIVLSVSLMGAVDQLAGRPRVLLLLAALALVFGEFALHDLRLVRHERFVDYHKQLATFMGSTIRSDQKLFLPEGYNSRAALVLCDRDFAITPYCTLSQLRSKAKQERASYVLISSDQISGLGTEFGVFEDARKSVDGYHLIRRVSGDGWWFSLYSIDTQDI